MRWKILVVVTFVSVLLFEFFRSPAGAVFVQQFAACNTNFSQCITFSGTRLLVDGSGVTQPISGNVGITGTPTVTLSSTQVQATPTVNNAAVSAFNPLPTLATLSFNNTPATSTNPFPVNASVSFNNSLVSTTNPLPVVASLTVANATLSSANGVPVFVPHVGNALCTGRTILSIASLTTANCKTVSSVVYGITGSQMGFSKPMCLYLFDKANSVNPGSDTPKITFPIPPAATSSSVNGAFALPLTTDGVGFSSGVQVLITGTSGDLCPDSNTVVAATGVHVNVITN